MSNTWYIKIYLKNGSCVFAEDTNQCFYDNEVADLLFNSKKEDTLVFDGSEGRLFVNKNAIEAYVIRSTPFKG